MTDPAIDVAVVTPASDENASYVDWPAIIAGIVLASAISLLLLTFGSAVGLGFADFRADEGASAVWIAIAAALWLLWVQISSFMAGGYLSGRLRRRHGGATEHEVDVRDGTHGLLVWAGALIVGVVIAAAGLGAAANAIASAASGTTGEVTSAPGDDMNPDAYYVDLLFRPALPGAATAAGDDAATEDAAAPAEEPDATTAPRAPTFGTGAGDDADSPVMATATSPATAASAASETRIERAEALRIFARAGEDELPANDSTYLALLVADNTGLSDAEAGGRVEEVLAARDTARAETEALAEDARKTGVLAAFLTAAALLVSGVGAYWAAQKGGQHHDEGTEFADIFRRV